MRTPPRPPYEGRAGVIIRPDGTTGRRCSLCGTEVAGRRLKWCSDECVWLWLVATNQTRALDQLTALHGHTCWRCGEPGWPSLEVDHRRPLWSLNAEERTELRWWLPFNLWLLCRRCHLAKTAAEAADRAAGLGAGSTSGGYQLALIP